MVENYKNIGYNYVKIKMLHSGILFWNIACENIEEGNQAKLF